MELKVDKREGQEGIVLTFGLSDHFILHILVMGRFLGPPFLFLSDKITFFRIGSLGKSVASHTQSLSFLTSIHLLKINSAESYIIATWMWVAEE